MPNWDELTTRERDELVAEYLLGWGRGRLQREAPPPYSTDLTVAWSVVEQLPHLRFVLEHFEQVAGERRHCTAGFRDMAAEGGEASWWARSASPAEAICKAALRACKVGIAPDSPRP